jgi:hypothetical protein
MEFGFMKSEEHQSLRHACFLNRTTCNEPVMPRESGASSTDGLAITGSPAFAGDDGRGPKRLRAFWRNEPETISAEAVAKKPQPRIVSAQILWMV